MGFREDLLFCSLFILFSRTRAGDSYACADFSRFIIISRIGKKCSKLSSNDNYRWLMIVAFARESSDVRENRNNLVKW